MKVELTYLHLHTPLFFAQVNWGEKLESRLQKRPFKMYYDREEKEFTVECDKRVCHIPLTNVVSWEEVSLKEEKAEVAYQDPTPTIRRRAKLDAQASTPHDHVFAGRGAGKTNDHQ